MDAHLRVLLRQSAAGKEDSADRYVWWAKLRSPNRQQPLPHTEEVLSLQEQIDSGVETHLYLTDYRSLYVGWLEEVTADPIRTDTPAELDHMPLYYKGKQADFWFRLVDIRRIISDDTPGIVDHLMGLSNTRYHDRPVSLYGGMVDLPLIVTPKEEVSWFGDREGLLDGALWAERDAENRSEVERMMRELRDNLLGEYVWTRLEPATRTFLASAEAVYRARRTDPNFDFSGPAVEYAKAVEVEVNALVFRTTARQLRKAQPKDREVRMNGRMIDLGSSHQHHSLGTIQLLLEKEALLRKALQVGAPSDWQWMCGILPHQLKPVIEARNPAAHSESIDREWVTKVRSDVVGIGCEGLVSKVAGVKGRVSG